MLDQLHGQQAEESWRWFIDRYRPYVRACLARVVGPPARAEQAAEEVWSYLFTAALVENADRSRRFRTYLAGTVRNFALGWLREHPSGEPEDGVVGHEQGGDPARDLEAEDLRLWKQQVVQLAMGELERRDERQARALRWFYGLPESMENAATEPRPASWIARELGLQANAVHQLLFRGRKRLRACLENELRETVRDADELDDELALVQAVIEQENPGLVV